MSHQTQQKTFIILFKGRQTTPRPKEAIHGKVQGAVWDTLCLRGSHRCGCNTELLGGLDGVESMRLQRSKVTAVALSVRGCRACPVGAEARLSPPGQAVCTEPLQTWWVSGGSGSARGVLQTGSKVHWKAHSPSTS